MSHASFLPSLFSLVTNTLFTSPKFLPHLYSFIPFPSHLFPFFLLHVSYPPPPPRRTSSHTPLSSWGRKVYFQIYRFIISNYKTNRIYLLAPLTGNYITLEWLYLYACMLVWTWAIRLLSKHCPSTVSHREISPDSTAITLIRPCLKDRPLSRPRKLLS